MRLLLNQTGQMPTASKAFSDHESDEFDEDEMMVEYSSSSSFNKSSKKFTNTRSTISKRTSITNGRKSIPIKKRTNIKRSAKSIHSYDGFDTLILMI